MLMTGLFVRMNIMNLRIVLNMSCASLASRYSVLANQELSQYQLNRYRGGVIPFLRIARLTSGNNILWCMFATLAYRYDMVFRETFKLFGAISTPISVCCFDIIPLFKRQSVDGKIEQCAPLSTLSIMQKRHSFFVGLFPFLSCRTTFRFVASVPIPIHCQFVLFVGSVTFAMLRQYVFAVIGIMVIRAFAEPFFISFSVSFHVINQALVAGIAITFCGVSFLLGTSRANNGCHYSIIPQEGC